MRAGSTPSGTRLLLKNEATGGEYRNQTGPTKAAGILALRRPHVIPWARSSAGRARESHSRGQGFESPRVHSCHLSRPRRRGRLASKHRRQATCRGAASSSSALLHAVKMGLIVALASMDLTTWEPRSAGAVSKVLRSPGPLPEPYSSLTRGSCRRRAG